MRHYLIAASLACFFASAASADKVTLKDGRTYEGTILSQSETEIKIDLGKNGAKVTLPMDQVVQIDRTAASPEQLYNARLLLVDRTSPEQLVGLADWCLNNKMEKEGVAHFVEALKLQPDNARARGRLAELGYREVNGAWLSPAEAEALSKPPEPETTKPDPVGPTSADVLKAHGKRVLAVSARKLPGVGVWASREGMVWVAGPAAAANVEVEVDLGDKKVPAKVVVRDGLRGIALWKVEVPGLPAPDLYRGVLPEKDPLVAISAGGIVTNLFARGWEAAGPEVWRIRLEGPASGCAIFDLSGKLVGLSGDGRGAVGAIDLMRLLLARPPQPEGAQNAGSLYWDALGKADGPALEMLRAGAKLEMFELGLGADDLNRGAALARELARLGGLLEGNLEDHIAGIRVARHCSRSGRLCFSVASAEILRKQVAGLLKTLPRLTPIELARLRAALDGLGPDPTGLELAVNGELKRSEALAFATRDIKAELDLQVAGYAFLGPEPVKSLEESSKAIFDIFHEQGEFSIAVRAACSRPDPTKREELMKLGSGPGAYGLFPEARDRALSTSTALAAARVAIKLRELRAQSGHYPAALPDGSIDPVSGQPFDYRPGKDGFTLTAPGGDVFRLKD